MAADNQNHLDEKAGVLVRTAFPVSDGSRLITLENFIANSDTSREFSFGILKSMILASFIREHGLIYRPGLKLGQDFYNLMQLFAAGGQGYLVNKALYDRTLPFGPISRAWTTTGDGAWRYDYRTTLDANAHFLQLIETSGQLELAILLRLRRQEYQVIIHYIDAQKALAQTGDRLTAAGIIKRHPSTWPLLAKRITGRLRRGVGFWSR